MPAISTPLTPATFEPASLWRRLAAMVYDSLIVIALIMAYGAIVLTIKYPLMGTPLALGERAQMGTPALAGTLLVIGAFFAFFWRSSGQTVGMKAWNLQILRPDGQFLTWQQALLRLLLACLSLALAGVGYLWCLWDPQGQTLHDRGSGTLTIRLPKPVKKSGR